MFWARKRLFDYVLISYCLYAQLNNSGIIFTIHVCIYTMCWYLIAPEFLCILHWSVPLINHSIAFYWNFERAVEQASVPFILSPSHFYVGPKTPFKTWVRGHTVHLNINRAYIAPMSSPRGKGEVVGHRVGIVTFSNKIVEIPTPGQKIIRQ